MGIKKKSKDDYVYEGFVLIVDTREQDPLFKRPQKGLVVVRDTLPVGDYSIRGFEASGITVERKSPLDFLSSISHGRERFKEMLKKMSNYERKFLVVEGTFQEVMSPIEVPKTKFMKGGKVRPLVKTQVQMHPNAIWQTIISIMLRYNVIFFFAENRKQAEDFVLGVLRKFYRLKRESSL